MAAPLDVEAVMKIRGRKGWSRIITVRLSGWSGIKPRVREGGWRVRYMDFAFISVGIYG